MKARIILHFEFQQTFLQEVMVSLIKWDSLVMQFYLASTRSDTDPQTRQFMESTIRMMLDNPALMDSLIQSNPQLKEMAEKHPEMNGAFNNPAVREMFKDPNIINSMIGMVSRSQKSAGSTLEGSERSFPRPGVITSNENNSNQLVINEKDVKFLEDMGFPREECIKAIRSTNGDLSKAVDLLAKE